MRTVPTVAFARKWSRCFARASATTRKPLGRWGEPVADELLMRLPE